MIWSSIGKGQSCRWIEYFLDIISWIYIKGLFPFFPHSLLFSTCYSAFISFQTLCCIVCTRKWTFLCQDHPRTTHHLMRQVVRACLIQKRKNGAACAGQRSIWNLRIKRHPRHYSSEVYNSSEIVIRKNVAEDDDSWGPRIYASPSRT